MINVSQFEKDLLAIQEKSPLIHNITNYVVMNNTANALLAIGASPVMAQCLEEVVDMTNIASALVLNIGTLDPYWVKAMLLAGKKAIEKQTPIVFDPVGAGATNYRTITGKQIIEECKPNIIRGNASEIMAIANAGVVTKGVDSTLTSDEALASAQQLALSTKSVVVISGQRDYITDGNNTVTVKNGHPMMSKVTGMGCTATALIGAFAAVNPNPFLAACHAMIVTGVAGELAAAKSTGNGSMQVNFLDELSNINRDIIYHHLAE